MEVVTLIGLQEPVTGFDNIWLRRDELSRRWRLMSLNPKVMPRLHDTTCCQTGCRSGLTTG